MICCLHMFVCTFYPYTVPRKILFPVIILPFLIPTVTSMLFKVVNQIKDDVL